MYPDQIGPYRIEKKIGSGGMGNVYYGIHTETRHVAAVKVLPASLAREDGFVERFSREIQALRTVNSQHIVQLFDDGSTDDGSWYYAMEYVAGRTLTVEISHRQRLPWTEVSDITLQISAALKAAHDAGVVHRDIKPSNLMLTEDGTVKLTDFGVAHVFATTRLTRTGAIVGTAEYMSPEQARGQRATKRSDLYSLGAVMYAMLTGRPPFTGKNVNEILYKQQFAQIEKPRHYVPEIPRLFEDLVCQLLEKKQECRIPDALVLIRKLEQVRSRVRFEENSSQERPAGTATATLVSPADLADTTVENRIDQGPGPATIVRDIVREEAAAQLEKSPLARFFDNTFVLIGMLILLVGLGFYLIRNATPSVEERFAEAKAIMSAEATPAWLRARDILQELLNVKALPEHVDDTQQMIRLANQYEFCRTLEQMTPIDGSKDSEIQRLIRRAFDRFAQADVAQARIDLKSVAALVNSSGSDRYLVEFIDSTLKKWEVDTSIKGRHELLASVLDEAREAARHPESAGSAKELLACTLTLYENDAAVTDEIEECRRLLAEIRSQVTDP